MDKIVWLVFMVIFFVLAIIHIFISTRKIGLFTNKGKVRKITGMNVGHIEFIDDFNEYLNTVNIQSRNINIITAIGYIGAGLTSLVSYCAIP